MVSRRKILSRSRDDLNLDQGFNAPEEDVWYQKDKLYKEHIQEVLDKWTQIDDEIWAKVIVFERNRRVAKAYARAPVLTINGSEDGFDGMRIGLCGFDNPMRDPKTEELKQLIGQGVKIKMDDAGNILIRRYAKSNVFVKSTASSLNDETSIGADILKLPHHALESEKIVKLFDMKKFQSNVNRELRRAYPDRRRLETQCLSIVAFVKSEQDVLDCPIWVLIVNVVAMDMLKSKLPSVQRSMIDIRNRPRIPIPDEDPYSVAGNGSAGSSGSSGFSNANVNQQLNNGFLASGGNISLNNGNGIVAATREQLLLQTKQLAHKRSEKPPKLPPRDNTYSHGLIPKPDYDDVGDVSSRVKISRGKSDKGKDTTNYDDPYYCGLRARVPNFAKSSKPILEHKDNYAQQNKKSIHSQITASASAGQLHSLYGPTQLMAPKPLTMNHMPNYQHQRMWQNRSYDNSIGIQNKQLRSIYTRDDLNKHYKLNEFRCMHTDDIDFEDRHKNMRCKKEHKQVRNIYVPTSYDGVFIEQDKPYNTRFQRSYTQIGVNCNCHSCIALAPLFDELTHLRPLYHEHQFHANPNLEHLSNELESPLMKWRSESDISVIDRHNSSHNISHDKEKRDLLNTPNYARQNKIHNNIHQRHIKSYNYGSENNLYGSILNYDSACNNNVENCIHYYNDEQTNMQKEQNNKSINRTLSDFHRNSLSNESFFEKPTEQGCFLYEGRKRIQSMPSKSEVLCENVPNSLQIKTANIKRCISQLCMQTKNCKYATKNASKIYNQRETTDIFHHRTQNQRNFEKSEVKEINTQTSKVHISKPKQHEQKKTYSKQDDKRTAPTKRSLNEISTANDLQYIDSHSKTNSNFNKDKLPSKPIKPNLHEQSLCDIANHANSEHLSTISHMECIYGYLKPRKQRSLTLKRIQILEQ